MKHRLAWTRSLIPLLLVVGLVVWLRPASRLHADAAPGADYTLDWWTVDGGGQTGPAGSGYTLEGTAGQPDAALWEGGRYALSGGFWVLDAGTGSEPTWVYLPLVVR